MSLYSLWWNLHDHGWAVLAGCGTSVWTSVIPYQCAVDLSSHHAVPPAFCPKPCRHQYFLKFFTSGTQGNPLWMDTAIRRLRVLLAAPFSDTKKYWSGKEMWLQSCLGQPASTHCYQLVRNADKELTWSEVTFAQMFLMLFVCMYMDLGLHKQKCQRKLSL